MFLAYPRVTIAGLGGDSGKTFLSIGLLKSWQKQGEPVRAFKKGPDYIDSAWLRWASGAIARNIDSYLMSRKTILATFLEHGAPKSVNLIEGNRGLYDGVDSSGTHSTAELAKTLDTPVILIVSAQKITRTVAALVLGCQHMDPDIRIAGIVLNRVATSRQESIITGAIQSECGISVIGAIPSMTSSTMLPGRHLGLITPAEHSRIDALEIHILDAVRKYVDVDRIHDIAFAARPLKSDRESAPAKNFYPSQDPVRIGVFQDSAFTFYYPENLEQLERAGATIVEISPSMDPELPDIDALYIGGGFPETHAHLLSQNSSMLDSVREAAKQGLPVYAECGGLIYLSRALIWNKVEFRMSGALPVIVQMELKPQGHGYSEMKVAKKNPFFPVNRKLKGHEFHYTRIISGAQDVEYAFQLNRGTGSHRKKDGIIHNNILASYIHIHASGVPDWGAALVKAAKLYRNRNETCTTSTTIGP